MPHVLTFIQYIDSNNLYTSRIKDVFSDSSIEKVYGIGLGQDIAILLLLDMSLQELVSLLFFLVFSTSLFLSRVANSLFQVPK